MTTHTDTNLDEREYVLGTDDAELDRLGLQHRLWSVYLLAMWERAGFRPDWTILDLGCGPGFASMDLARMLSDKGRILAIDESASCIARLNEEAKRHGYERLISASVGDAQRLDLAPGSVDGAFTRWMLCFVEKPESVIEGVARALRPGGVFAIQDYFNYQAATLAPKSDAFTNVIEATAKSWHATGGDPDIGGRLPKMLEECGLRVTEIRPLLRIARPGSLLWRWPETFFETFLPRLIEMELLSVDDQRAFWADWKARSDDPSSFFQTPPMVEIIAVKQ